MISFGDEWIQTLDICAYPQPAAPVESLFGAVRQMQSAWEIQDGSKHLLCSYRSSCWSWTAESRKLDVQQSFAASVVNGSGIDSISGTTE